MLPTFALRRATAASLLALAAAVGACLPARAVDEKDLLPVDQAFALSASAPQRDRIELRWRIAKGYYLYRHRIAVQATGFDAGALQLPPGHRKHDEFFGDVETYRDELVAVQPGTPAPGASSVTLKVKYQGFAHVGV
jgi:thiol:disulfide interchange protein DsbD